MLTDPTVTPQKNIYQIFFGLLMASIAVFLDMFYGYRVQNLFIALFILSAFNTIFIYCRSKKDIIISIVVIIFIFTTIATVQQKPPFYFEMEG
jgi:hypothetical protein